MMKALNFILVVFFCVLSVFVFGVEEIEDKVTHASFPDHVLFKFDDKEYTLQATGVSTRKKFFVPIYSVAHYFQSGEKKFSGDKFDQILQDDKAKQLTLKWVRNISVAKIQDGYRESFQKTLSEMDLEKLNHEINTFIHFFNRDVQTGDEYILRWIPPETILVLINGNEVGKINNEDFAKALWSLWFGSKSVVNRDNLISLFK